jgi:hypothetical protein
MKKPVGNFETRGIASGEMTQRPVKQYSLFVEQRLASSNQDVNSRKTAK